MVNAEYLLTKLKPGPRPKQNALRILQRETFLPKGTQTIGWICFA